MKYSTEPLISLIRRENEKNESGENWTILNPLKHKLARNNIIIFGGNNTNSSREANGYAKGIEILLDEKIRNNLDILSFYYKNEPIHRSGGGISPEYIEEINNIYLKLFSPLLFQYGKIKSIESLESTFQKLTFVSHCGGANFINHIIENFYLELLQYYSENEALMAVGKLRLFSYAPNELPLCNVNSFAIMPSQDNEQAWAQVIYKAKETKIDNDYPKGFVSSCKKDKYKDLPGKPLSEALKENQACMIKIGREFYLIPRQLNSSISGEHSIECIYRDSIINAPTPYAQTAKTISIISRLVLNKYASGDKFDRKEIFRKITEMLETPPEFLKT